VKAGEVGMNAFMNLTKYTKLEFSAQKAVYDGEKREKWGNVLTVALTPSGPTRTRPTSARLRQCSS
jgi:hypothetical protein